MTPQSKNTRRKLDPEAFANKLRNNPTQAETIFLNALLHAMRDFILEPICQYPVGPYMADFKVKNLLIEIDGEYHKNQQAYDSRRESFLKHHGYRIIRFDNAEILKDATKCAAQVIAITAPHQLKHDGEVPVTICPPSQSFYRKDKKTHKFRENLWGIGFSGRRS